VRICVLGYEREDVDEQLNEPEQTQQRRQQQAPPRVLDSSDVRSPPSSSTASYAAPKPVATVYASQQVSNLDERDSAAARYAHLPFILR